MSILWKMVRIYILIPHVGSPLSRLPCSLAQSSFRVATPKSRYHRRNYYYWLKHVDIPKANWLLITLTLTRKNMPLAVAWLLIGYFISLFLNRMRNYSRRYGKKFHTYGSLNLMKMAIHMFTFSYPFLLLVLTG